MTSVSTQPALERLDPRWITYGRRAGWVRTAIVALLLAGGILAGTRLAALPLLPLVIAALAITAGVAVLARWWPGLAWRYASYRLDQRTLEIRRGVLWRSVIEVPRSRIQHSDVSQGPLERLHGLGTLTVFTAGMRLAAVRLRGLDHERAHAMRDQLMSALEDDVV